MNSRYFINTRNDVLANDKLSLGTKVLYYIICYDLVSLKKILLNPDIKAKTIKYGNELMKYDYAHFYNLEECGDKNHILVLMFLYTHPIGEFKNLVDLKYKNIKN